MMRYAFALVLLPFSALALAAACGSDDEGKAGPSAQLTYQRDVRAIVEQNCVSCHSAEGGAPFSMVYDPAEWQNGPPVWVESAAAAVAAGTMPPWLPDEATCRPLKGSRKLTAEQVRAFADWKASGFSNGDEAAYVAPTATAPLGALADDRGPPTFEVAPESPYQPNRDQPDDYRCFFLPLEFAQETYLTGSMVVPGERSMVHHVLLYLIPPNEVARAQQVDAAEPGLGYTCFGGPGGGSTNVGGWVPGSVPQRTPEGSAMVVPAGARIVMQVHYNVLSQPTDRPLPLDQTRTALWAMPAGQKPTHRVEVLPLAHLGLSIAPGDPTSVQERVFTLPMGGELVSATAHMHLRGTRIRAQLEPAGQDPACLLDIPSWDFNWQQAYSLPDDSFVPVKAGDKVRVTCEYDNTKENQPIVNGQQQEPRLITWGEGTLDEMCLMYVHVRAPFAEVPSRCGGFAACASTCPPGSGECLINCSIDAGGQCPSCLLPGVARCAPVHCPLEGLALQQCLAPCGTTIECLQGTCAAQADTFFGCMGPHLASGDCNADIGVCGANLVSNHAFQAWLGTERRGRAAARGLGRPRARPCPRAARRARRRRRLARRRSHQHRARLRARRRHLRVRLPLGLARRRDRALGRHARRRARRHGLGRRREPLDRPRLLVRAPGGRSRAFLLRPGTSARLDLPARLERRAQRAGPRPPRRAGRARRRVRAPGRGRPPP
ncbi:MAG: hypothetical protein MUF34_19665 [Polyangiaceae bacterium]|jgi:mono/diheme cytochrome c family protein|nr:hypothetical protein [Polyangiaceae bacterium]